MRLNGSLSGLKIVATNSPSHRALDKNKNILFFTQNDEESFKSALLKASKQELFGNQQETESMTSRTENIINFTSQGATWGQNPLSYSLTSLAIKPI